MMERKIINNNRYLICNDGSIFSLLKNKFINGGINPKNGYRHIRLKTDNGYKTYYIHRLVAEAFIPNIENKPEIDHINGNRTDNRVENLRWTTKKENRNNPITIQRMSDSKKGRPAHNKKPVKQYTLNGELAAEYESITEAAKKNNMRRTDISMVLSGRQKTANGFKWVC